MDRAGEISRLREIAGSAEQHGGVSVMAAAMHFSLVLGTVVKGVHFLHVERVHVSAQTNRTSIVGLCTPQGPDHAGARQAPMHLVAEFGQLSRDEIGCAELLERCFGMHVEVAPPRSHLDMIIGNPVDDRHGRLLTASRMLYIIHTPGTI
jgi:hypothetical protein